MWLTDKARGSVNGMECYKLCNLEKTLKIGGVLFLILKMGRKDGRDALVICDKTLFSRVPDSWKMLSRFCYLHQYYHHHRHFLPFMVYVFKMGLDLGLGPKDRQKWKFLLLLVFPAFSFPSPKLYFLCCLLFSDIPRHRHPHFLHISLMIVLNDHLPQCLAWGMKAEIWQGDNPGERPDTNHQEEAAASQVHTREARPKST